MFFKFVGFVAHGLGFKDLGEELLREQFQLMKLFLSGYFRFQSQLLHPQEVFADYFLSLWHGLEATPAGRRFLFFR